MRLSVVGCSGSVPGPDSPASCYLLEAPGGQAPGGQAPGVEAPSVNGHGETRTWRIVLDLGNGSLGALQRLVDPVALDAVLLSHLHPDHCLDLCGLYVLLRHRPGPSRPDRIPVWGPPGTADRMARAYDLEPAPGMHGEFAFESYVDRQPFAVGPFGVTPVRVEHPVEAYGLRVEHQGAVLAYTGDTDTCAALTPLCQGADLMLADSSFVDGRDDSVGIHLSGRRAARAAVDAGGVRRLVLTHLPPWNDPQVCLAQARAVWEGPLDLAGPGTTYDI